MSLLLLSAVETCAFSFGKRLLSKEAIEYRLKGYKASQSKDYDEAIKYLQKASLLDPYYAAPHNDLGIIYEIKGWLERAEKEYLKALAIDPNNAEAVMNLGLLYESRQAYEKAIPYFQKRIELGPLESPWVKRAKNSLSRYAPELYKEITQKEEARNLMYQALDEQHDGKSDISNYKEEAVQSQVRESELIVDAQVENYLKLEKDITNPNLKNNLLGITAKTVEMLYGSPYRIKTIRSDGYEEEDLAYNKWLKNLNFGSSVGKELYSQEGKKIYKAKWIYKIPYRYKKYALKPQIILRFEYGMLAAWER